MAPTTHVRDHTSFWWVRDTPSGIQMSSSTSEDLVLRAQRIWGGYVEVIHQQITTVTTVEQLP